LTVEQAKFIVVMPNRVNSCDRRTDRQNYQRISTDIRHGSCEKKTRVRAR